MFRQRDPNTLYIPGEWKNRKMPHLPSPENYAKLRKLVLAHAEDLRDLLENNDIDSFRTEAGAAFNHKRHSVLKTVVTDDPSLAKTIQASLRWGFEKDGKVIRPEKVAVYVLATE